MKLDGLSMEQAPPISVPFRFFIAAPVFGLLSVLLLIYLGQDILQSRWSPGVLAIAHGWLLGFFATVVFGVLLQMLPVLAGAIINSPVALANTVLPIWLSGVFILQFAFLKTEPSLFLLATLLLGLAVLVFVVFSGAAMLRATSQIDSVLGMKLALISLFITLLLGIALGLGHAGLIPLLRPLGTNVHAIWGLLGWIGLLIFAVSWQVVPMFQLTANYPRWMQRFFVPMLFVLILVRTVVLLAPTFSDQLSQSSELFTGILDLAISLLLVTFAFVTIWLQRSRKRKVSDTHPLYWRTGCVSLIFAVVCWWTAHWSNQLDLREQLKLLCVLLFVVGFVMSIMTAMLYKIVAFLVWFHLQATNTKRLMAGQNMIEVPHMKAVISEKQARMQFWVYQAAVLMVLLVVVWPQGTVLMGAAWLLYFVLMIINFSSATVRYREAISNDSLR